ncbi:unnamed protein product [Eruca vesicaria subsp. sativa]|uniref:Uncharacterized protein n=1 Tax=Eruca vesicaria subsp. sativa TaxID=29727 RepID=A0ABC8KS69_ERUVS|nr:unnamed protein product [Eruca vesicaria subsp. sativa]
MVSRDDSEDQEIMGSRHESGDQEMRTDYSPLNTCDFETQNLIAKLAAEEEVAAQVADVRERDGKKQGSKRKLISLVDSEDDSDVEITPLIQKSKPRRQTSFGTASQKPMLQSTLDRGSGSSARVSREDEVDGKEEKLPSFESIVGDEVEEQEV